MSAPHRAISDEPGGPCVTCGYVATTPVHLPDGSPHPDYSFEERDPMSIEQNLSEFVLNIPAILETRKAVSDLQVVVQSGSESRISDSDWDAIADTARDQARDYFEGDVDFGQAVEDALSYGYVDLNSHIDADEIVKNSYEFSDLNNKVEQLEADLEEVKDEATDENNISDLQDAVRELTSALDAASDKIADLEARLDNASINI